MSLYWDVNAWTRIYYTWLWLFLSTGLFGFLLGLALAGAQALTPAHYLSLSDVGRLQNLLSQEFTDLEAAYYSVVGLTKLGATVPDHKVRKLLLENHLFFVKVIREKHLIAPPFVKFCLSCAHLMPFLIVGCVPVPKIPARPNKRWLSVLCCWNQSGHFRMWGMERFSFICHAIHD